MLCANDKVIHEEPVFCDIDHFRPDENLVWI